MIERRSATYRALVPQLQALRAAGVTIAVGREVESFAAVVQLARSGFGPALVPWPLARALGVTRANVIALPAPGLSRPVSLIGRKSALIRPAVAAFRSELLKASPRCPEPRAICRALMWAHALRPGDCRAALPRLTPARRVHSQILVPVDLSDGHPHTLAAAVDLARQHHAPITLLHVIENYRRRRPR